MICEKLSTLHEISLLASFLSYSEERDDGHSKVWYQQDVLLEKAPVEVQPDMGRDPRVHVTPDHSLVLHNVTYADTGVYQCLDFSFLVDGKPLEIIPLL
jgi:hypothetical protein